MQPITHKKHTITLMVVAVWIINCILTSVIVIKEIWIPYMNAREWIKITSDAFDGTIMPINYIPNWKYPQYRDKSIHFNNIPMKDLIPLPEYNLSRLQNPNNLIDRYTYTVLYMGSYSLNYKEYDGSHLGVDIRAPIGTPVLSIANGVVVRAVENKNTNENRFVVIRHDNVPINGEMTTLYSSYLHLSEVWVEVGKKIRKWEMLGKVGNTGISTAPHLHLQIDTDKAPFHPYWPFTNQEAQKNKMNIFQAVSAGLWKEKAIEYTINPLNFIKHNITGKQNIAYKENIPKNIPPVRSLEELAHFQVTPTENNTTHRSLEDLVSYNEGLIVASHIAQNPNYCENKHINTQSKFWKNAKQLQDKYCIFSDIDEVKENNLVTRAESLTMLMKFFNENPEIWWVSPFFDIPLGDNILQGYALKAYQKWIFRWHSFNPNGTLTRAEFIEIIARFWKLNIAPKNYIAYTDISKNSTLYTSVNNYGYTIGIQRKQISPNSLLTQKDAIEILQLIAK